MELNIKVIPNSSINKIVNRDDKTWKVKLTAPAIEGKANKALISFLAKELKISKSQIKIIKGLTSKNKIIKIEV